VVNGDISRFTPDHESRIQKLWEEVITAVTEVQGDLIRIRRILSYRQETPMEEGDGAVRSDRERSWGPPRLHLRCRGDCAGHDLRYLRALAVNLWPRPRRFCLRVRCSRA
jgi:hypothetical protein